MQRCTALGSERLNESNTFGSDETLTEQTLLRFIAYVMYANYTIQSTQKRAQTKLRPRKRIYAIATKCTKAKETLYIIR